MFELIIEFIRDIDLHPKARKANIMAGTVFGVHPKIEVLYNTTYSVQGDMGMKGKRFTKEKIIAAFK
jgi:hypothetical protein